MTDINEVEIAEVIISNVNDLLNAIPEDSVGNIMLKRDRAANIAKAVNVICLLVRDVKKELNVVNYKN